VLLANFKTSFRYIIIFVLLIVISLFSSPHIYASELIQKDLYDSGIYKYDLNPGESCSTVSSIPGSGVGGVFYIGDSLTVGMVGSGGLLAKTSEAGFTANAELRIDTATQKSGLSVEATQGYSVSDTIENLSENTARFADDKVSIIVVMLGTNPESNQAQATQDMVTYIRDFNKTAKIVWLNTYTKNSNNYVAINNGIQQGVSALGDNQVSILDFAASAESVDYSFANDGIHHTSAGYGLKADFVVSNLPGQNSENFSASGCGGLVPAGTGDNDVDLINALKNSGMTIEQAVGILANVKHESGNNPKRHECVYSVEDGLKKNIPAEIMEAGGEIKSANQAQAAQILFDGDRCAIIDGRRVKTTPDGYGWGLVQWTPAKKIILVSSDKGVPYELIDSMQYQGDFLISQLKGESVGLLLQYGVNAGTDEASRNSGFFNTTTPEDAAEFFAINYERCARCKPGNPEITKRRGEASDLFIQYGSL